LEKFKVPLKYSFKKIIIDYYFGIKYTDIDYGVYTDAALIVSEGGTPYDRHTYRYTPLLAYMMLPNIYYYKSFGKILFILSDILCGLLLSKILKKWKNLNEK